MGPPSIGVVSAEVDCFRPTRPAGLCGRQKEPGMRKGCSHHAYSPCERSRTPQDQKHVAELPDDKMSASERSKASTSSMCGAVSAQYRSANEQVATFLANRSKEAAMEPHFAATQGVVFPRVGRRGAL